MAWQRGREEPFETKHPQTGEAVGTAFEPYLSSDAGDLHTLESTEALHSHKPYLYANLMTHSHIRAPATASGGINPSFTRLQPTHARRALHRLQVGVVRHAGCFFTAPRAAG